MSEVIVRWLCDECSAHFLDRNELIEVDEKYYRGGHGNQPFYVDTTRRLYCKPCFDKKKPHPPGEYFKTPDLGTMTLRGPVKDR